MKSVNKIILLGSVGHDPEVKYTASGIPVGRFSLATNERFKDKSGKFQGPHRMAQHCGLAETCQGRGRVRFPRLAPIYRREIPNYKSGRRAERRKEIPD
jgi:hypothetical protein